MDPFAGKKFVANCNCIRLYPIASINSIQAKEKLSSSESAELSFGPFKVPIFLERCEMKEEDSFF